MVELFSVVSLVVITNDDQLHTQSLCSWDDDVMMIITNDDLDRMHWHIVLYGSPDTSGSIDLLLNCACQAEFQPRKQ